MRNLILPLALLFTARIFAADTAPLLNKPGAVVSQPDFKQPLGSEWSVAKGKWEPADGVLTASEIPDEHHAAVLHIATGPKNLIVECDFRFDGGKAFLVGCDGTKHVGRVVITQGSIKLCEDSTEVKGKTPSHVLTEAKCDVKPGDWQHLRVEYAGDRMAAQLNDIKLDAQDPYLATPKLRWWFAAGGATVQLRNVVVTEGVPLAAQ